MASIIALSHSRSHGPFITERKYCSKYFIERAKNAVAEMMSRFLVLKWLALDPSPPSSK